MLLAVNHPDIRRVDGDIFTVTFTADCMTHACRCRGENDRPRNDACCQHGADVLIPEKAAILRRAREIASIMREPWSNSDTWFDERDPELDPDAPGGVVLRTGTSDPEDDTSGCVFLAHSGQRGCGLHRTALLHGFDPAEIKPKVCRLYPLSWDGDYLGLSPDFARYSCAGDAGPTVYTLMRQLIQEIFGPELVRELDGLSNQVASTAPQHAGVVLSRPTQRRSRV